MTNIITDLLMNRVMHNPKVTGSSINYTTQFITHIAMEEENREIYKGLYSKVENLCKQTGKILKTSNELKDLEVFFNSDPNNIIFLIESLTEKTAICALEVYNLHYHDHNEKLLDYFVIESNSILRQVYLENGADISAFALTTAVYFFQNTELEF